MSGFLKTIGKLCLRLKGIILLLGCCLGLAWGFWHYAVPRLIEIKIDQLCRLCFDGSFAAEHLHWKDGLLVIECPSLISSSSLGSGGHQCLASRATISYKLSFWEREIALKLALESPKISIGKDLPRLLRSMSWIDDAPGFFDIQPHLIITDGSFTHSSGHQWGFDLDIDFTDLPTGKFEVKIGEAGDDGVFIGHLFKDPKGALGIKIDISDVSLDHEYIQLSKLNGNISLTEGRAGLTVEGNCHYCGKNSSLALNGKAQVSGLNIDSSDLVVDIDNSAKVHFISSSKNSGMNFGELAMSHIGKEEFALAKSFLGERLNAINFIEMQDGNFDIHLKGQISHGVPDKLFVDNLVLRDLHVELPLWQMAAYFPKASASASMDLAADNILNTLDLAVTLEDCKVDLQAFKKPCENINAHFSLKEGRLQKSNLEGEFIGLNGKMTLDGGSSESLVNIKLSGDHAELVKLFPDNVRQGIDSRFAGDQLSIEADVQRHPKGITVGGRINIIDPTLQQEYPIGINFDLVKTSDAFWPQWPPHQQACSYCNDFAMDTLTAFMPGVLSPALLLCTEWMQQQLGWNGLVIQNGTFAAPQLPLEKFMEPFLFEFEQFNLSGVGDFEGSFDFNSAIMRYNSKSLILENDGLTFEILPITNEICSPTFSGEHFFDFKRQRHYGDFTFDKAVYYEKNRGLLFTDFKSTAISEGARMYLGDIEASCHQIAFTGAIDIDYSSPEPGFFDVDVYVKTLNGKVSNLQGLFSHFEHLQKLSTIPLEGEVELDESGGHMRFAFEQDDFRLQADSKGILSQCQYISQFPGIELENLSIKFDYDHEEKSLQLEALRGNLHLGLEAPNSHYSVAGSLLNIVDVNRGVAYFDLLIDGELGQLLRLKGKSYPSTIDVEAPLHYSFDKNLTHFASAHPTLFELSMDNDLQVDQFQLKLPFNLNEMLYQVRPLVGNCQNEGLQALLNENNSGICSIDLSYDSVHSQFLYNLKGYDLSLAGRQINDGFVIGKKRGSRWSIEQMQLDKLSIAADIIKNENSLNFDFLGLSWGDSLLAGLEGEYSFDKKAFNGQVNLLEADLSQLGSWPDCEAVANRYFPEGRYKANGKVNIEFINFGPGWRLNTWLNGSMSKLKILGFHFDDINSLSCHWDSNERLSFDKFAANFSDSSYGPSLGSLAFEKGEYDFVSEEVSLVAVEVNTSAPHLDTFTNLLQGGFPAEVSDFTANLIRGCKLQGPLFAKASLKVSPTKHHFNLQLPDGKYWFNGAEHEFSNFNLTNDPANIQVLMKYHHPHRPFWVLGSCLGNELNHGLIFVANSPEAFNRREMGPDIVRMSWREDPLNGFVIDDARGQFCGLGIDLKKAVNPAPGNMIALSGMIALNVPVCSSLFAPETREGLAAWGVGKGYFLQGEWYFRKKGLDELEPAFTFNGRLFGNSIEFDGYEFESLDSQLDWTSERMQFSNLWLQDPAGGLQIERLTMLDTKQGDLWGLSLRNLTISNFRPSLLKHVDKPTPRTVSHFVIPKLDIGELSGVMGIPTSFKGKGVFHFTNHSKRVIHHPLFVIPTEILHRIGLDMGVLTPVTGSIFFDIHDEKVFLTKFKDVYSEGKLSKFYLPSSFGSIVDFNGNLNLQVRMKQYNLLFKLAELFTVNVTGNLDKPLYSLNKQQRKNPNGVKRKFSH